MYLGFQSQITTRAGVDFAIRADARTYRAIEAAHNPTLLWEMKRALPRCLFGLRLVRDIDPSNPVQAAGDFYDALMPKLLEFPYDFVSGANETGYHADTAVAYSDFNVILANLLRGSAEDNVRRVLYGAYDFGVTWPNVSLIDSYRPGLRACDMLFVHGYKLPHISDENTIYHHRHVRAALSPELRLVPIWYSEFGLDANGQEGDGWSGPTWGWSAEQYAAWLETTAAELTDVEHGIVFLGEETDPKWRSWRIVGHDVIADAMARANKAEDKRREETQVPTFEYAFRILAQELGPTIVGEPLEQQGPANYDGFGNVMLFTTTGLMVYNARVNKAHFLPGYFPKASGPII